MTAWSDPLGFPSLLAPATCRTLVFSEFLPGAGRETVKGRRGDRIPAGRWQGDVGLVLALSGFWREEPGPDSLAVRRGFGLCFLEGPHIHPPAGSGRPGGDICAPTHGARVAGPCLCLLNDDDLGPSLPTCWAGTFQEAARGVGSGIQRSASAQGRAC